MHFCLSILGYLYFEDQIETKGASGIDLSEDYFERSLLFPIFLGRTGSILMGRRSLKSMTSFFFAIFSWLSRYFKSSAFLGMWKSSDYNPRGVSVSLVFKYTQPGILFYFLDLLYIFRFFYFFLHGFPCCIFKYRHVFKRAYFSLWNTILV